MEGKPEEQQENYLEQLQRLQAEFENYQKRVQKEEAEKKKYASTALLQKLLGLVDAFEQAMKSMKGEDEHSKGMQLLHQSLLQVLEEEGVRAMDTVGKQFTPEEHEVMGKVESEKNEGVIVEDVQKGYIYKEKILRHAKVKISAGKKT